jgi:hypothetical protein
VDLFPASRPTVAGQIGSEDRGSQAARDHQDPSAEGGIAGPILVPDLSRSADSTTGNNGE